MAGKTVIFDAGSGIEPLGRTLMQRGETDVSIFLTHAHYDHVIGLPFFAPLHAEGASATLHYAGSADAPDGASLLQQLIRAPFLPFAPSDFRARIDHVVLPRSGTIRLGPDCEVSVAPVNHPGGSHAFRVTTQGRSFVYVPDFEHDDGDMDAALVSFLEGADIALLDCTYSPDEYPRFRGLGHSHWDRVAEIAQAAGVARWGVFHHAHTRADSELDELADVLMRDTPQGFVVSEGMSFDLSGPEPVIRARR